MMMRGLVFGCLLVIGFIAHSHASPASSSFKQDIMIVDGVLTEQECAQIREQAGPAFLTTGSGRIALSTEPTWKPWDERLLVIFGDTIRTYVAQYEASGVLPPVTQDMGYLLTARTAQNGTLAPYADKNALISAVLFLNDDVAGGEWEFPRQQQRDQTPIASACGRVIVYPSGFTHPRGAKAVRLGTQWFILTWFK
jgi:hypothetical protein